MNNGIDLCEYSFPPLSHNIYSRQEISNKVQVATMLCCIKQYSSVSSRYSTPLQSFYDNNQISIQYSVGSSIELPDNKLYQVTYHIKYGI